MRDPLTHARNYAALARALATAKAPWAAVAIIALALILSACGLDREYLQGRRGDLQELCQGALTAPLRAACERAGIDTSQPAM